MSNPQDRDSLNLMADNLVSSAPWLTADRVEYIADMVEELKAIADRGGLQTLSGILGLAAAEARSQVSRMAGRS